MNRKRAMKFTPPAALSEERVVELVQEDNAEEKAKLLSYGMRK